MLKRNRAAGWLVIAKSTVEDWNWGTIYMDIIIKAQTQLKPMMVI